MKTSVKQLEPPSTAAGMFRNPPHHIRLIILFTNHKKTGLVIETVRLQLRKVAETKSKDNNSEAM